METKNLTKILSSALMAAFCCVATMLIAIPTPTGGYVHPGDGLVIATGIILGPIYGGLASAIGSMFADIFSGYMIFAPATFIIKGLAAVLAYYGYKHIKFKPVISGGMLAGIIVVSGYYLFEATFLGYGFIGSLVGIPGNIVQSIFGIAISALIVPVLKQIPMIKELMY